MSSCVCKILFKSEQICGCCCKMLRGSLFWDTRYFHQNGNVVAAVSAQFVSICHWAELLNKFSSHPIWKQSANSHSSGNWPLNRCLRVYTVGQLLLWSVNSALIAPSPATNDVVYEVKFIDTDYFHGFVSRAIYLRLSARYHYWKWFRLS